MATVMPAPSQSSGTIITSTPKLAPRRPSLVRKRDDDEEPPPSSPSKRSRVTFDSDVEVRSVGEYEKAPELIQEEVRSALEKRAWGDDSGYESIKAVYSRQEDEDDDPSPTTLRNYTIALLSNISSLNKSTADLIRTVLKSEWIGRDEEYVSLFVRLLANIVTAQGSFLADTLRMLVDNLTATPPSSGRLPNIPQVSRMTIHTRSHEALRYLIQLIPSASGTLKNALVQGFPHHTDSRRLHVVYVQNLLKILDYASELRSDILALITERLVKIDVQVQVDLEDLAEEIGEGLVQRIPQARPDLLDDLEDDLDSSDEESESDEDDDAEVQRTKDVIKNVEKMDSILDILFSYYSQDAPEMNTKHSSSTAVEVLLSQFATIILPTYRSRHTQFLLFHFVQQSPAYVDHFVGICVHTAFDRKQPAIIRQTAAAYLASFVARGVHVPSNIVRDVFDYIGSELDRQRKDHEPACRGPDLRRYSSFYSLVQALLYIFCFRWRDLESKPDEDDDDDLDTSYSQDHLWKSGVKEALSANLFSKLNPLKVCSPAIVDQFAKIAKHLGVVYVYHILEVNKRIRLSQHTSGASASAKCGHPDRETALSVSNDESHQHLDAYFPFDPYHLPKSKRWIEADYQVWAGIPGLDEEEASDSGSEDEDDIVESDFEGGTETDRTGVSP
ncbi:MAG: hypothetical protein Q9164_001602 [Protoblastenia rupestris]